jgi:energy-coupling factor transport system permease protein
LHSQGARRIRKPLNAATAPLHPAGRILIYLLAALAIPGLSFYMLPVLLLLALLVLIMQRRAPLRLVWRTRWLLLVLFFGYAYSLPGEPVWLAWGSAAPTWEGVRHGAEQAARLIVLLLWLDMLVLRLPAQELLAGLYQLLRVFTWLGLDPRRVALRLGLTLRAIEDMERGRGNLRSLLKLDFQVDLPQQIHLHLSPLRLVDVAIPTLVFAGLLGAWLTTA